jgi:hypothetical protein
LKSHEFSISAFAKWILSGCVNIHTLKVESPKQSNGLHNEIARLKKLKKIEIEANASDLKEVTLIASRILTTLLTSS